MTLSQGARVGAYQILGALGAGGMGEVYRARDGKLNRDVAIKLLPSEFAADRDRLARFEREAQTLASLNHPNIAQIFGVVENPPALVMEYVDGEDLAQRLSRGRMPVDDAVAIARQIIDALEAAHEQGIVHRDLKPANVIIRADGAVKVLDFGLAKAVDPAAISPGSALANSPTFTAQQTQIGMVVGTAAYMAPEQARGRNVDRRADIWAFGAVLYEMLTGRKAFEGDDISDVLASVLKSEPAWTALPADVPPAIRRLLRRCLEKDPRRRLSGIADARFDLEESDAAPPPNTPSRRPRLLPIVAAASAGIALTASIAWLWTARRAAPSAGVRRFSMLAPSNVDIYPDSVAAAISPDGTKAAFTVGHAMLTDSQLWVRSVESLEARHLDGVDGARLPFWSPDSRMIGYFADNKLMAVPAAGGRPQVLAEGKGAGRGAAWSTANVIVFAPDTSGPLYRVSASGGTPMPITTLDETRHQYAHRFPMFLPDGDHFLYAALPSRNGRFDVFAGSLGGGAPLLVGAFESAPVYANGYLLSTRQGVLTAQPFDAASLKLSGEPVTLGDEPTQVLDPTVAYTSSPAVSAAANGSLLYYSSASQNTLAVWYDATGRMTGSLSLPPGHYDTIRISPDGTQAIAVRGQSPSKSSLWLVDLAHDGAVLLSNAPGRNDQPVWSPDGAQVIFASDREGASNLFVKSVTDPTPEQPFFRSPAMFKTPNAWSPDGKWIVVTELDPGTGQNVWVLPTAEPRELRPLIAGPQRDAGGAISPDGRWLAYYSDETGRMQLYVMPFPQGGRKLQVSQDGAIGAGWSRDGRTITYVGLDGRTVWRVAVSGNTTFSAAAPVRVAEVADPIVDATPDGQRFLALRPDRKGPGSLTVVQNWRAALPR